MTDQQRGFRIVPGLPRGDLRFVKVGVAIAAMVGAAVVFAQIRDLQAMTMRPRLGQRIFQRFPGQLPQPFCVDAAAVFNAGAAQIQILGAQLQAHSITAADVSQPACQSCKSLQRIRLPVQLALMLQGIFIEVEMTDDDLRAGTCQLLAAALKRPAMKRFVITFG